MKAFPSLLVGLAVAAAAGCSSSNLQPRSGAGPRPLAGSPSGLPTLGTPVLESGEDFSAADPRQEDLAVELGTGSRSAPALTTPPDEEAAHTVASRTRPLVEWQTAYESQERRPIQTLNIGDGQYRILVTGSLHGDDAESVRLMDLIAARLTARESHASRFLLLRTLNPDGLAVGQSCNANGVDLNLNFPSLRFVPHFDGRNGPGPASEPETRVMLRLLSDFQPRRVVQLRTADVPLPRVFVNEAAEAELAEILDDAELERGRFQEIAIPGSLEEFVSQRLHAESVTMIVPASTAREPESIESLMALLTDGTATELPSQSTPVAQSQIPSAEPVTPRAPAALTGDLEPVDQDGVHGYVELLPPPPGPENESGRPDFFELPPPTSQSRSSSRS